jgi:tetratricopeptide (TPR) repeat protein
MVAVIVGSVALAYANTFSGPFVFDDAANIVGNASIRDLRSMGQVLLPPPDAGVGGRPIYNLSLALSYAVGGSDVAGYHAFNLLIHLAACLTLFGIVRRSLADRAIDGRFAQNADAIALVVALIWGLHPLQVEAVTYISQRAEELMGLFYLLTLYCFIRAVGPGARRPIGWAALAVLACFLGMATKEVMVTAPLVVFLYDSLFVAGSFRVAWRRRWPLYVSLLSSWALLAALMRGLARRDVGYDLGVSWVTTALTECHAVAIYLVLSVWPHPLVFYRDPIFIHEAERVILPGALLIALLVSTLILLIKRPRIGFAGAWIFIILAPTSTVVPILKQPVAEHRMYLSLAGLAVLFVVSLFAWAGRRSLILGALAALVLAGVTWTRNQTYRSEVGLWTDTANKEPFNSAAQNNLGLALLNLGHYQDAIGPCRAAVRDDARNELAHNNLGSALVCLGRPAEAVAEFTAAIQIRPTFADAEGNLGGALQLLGRSEEAIAHCRKAIELQPRSAKAHNNLGSALDPAHPVEALHEYEDAVRLDSTYADFRSNLARELGELGRWPEAVDEYKIVAGLQPQSAEAAFDLAFALEKAGRTNEAIVWEESTLRLEPDHVGARNNLASHLIKIPGREPEAIAHLRSVVRIQPKSAVAHRDLGFALGATGQWREAILEERAALAIDSHYQLARDELAAALTHRVP